MQVLRNGQDQAWRLAEAQRQTGGGEFRLLSALRQGNATSFAGEN